MLKRLLQGAALAIPALVIAAVIMIAQSLWVPVPKDRYEDCFYAAKQSGNKHPDCRLYETIWERGLVDPTAYYTLWLTLFTGVLAAVGIAGTVVGLQQIRLARDEFNATHRPRVVVTNFSLKKELVDGKMVILCFMARNAGDSPCRVTEVRSATFTLDPREKIPSDYSFPFVEKFDFPLAGGGGNELFPANGAHTLEDEAFPIFEGKRILYCVGTITYEGVGGKREMGFCRRYTPPDHWEITNSEYEYSY